MIVKFKDVVPLRAMVPAPNVFVIEGGDKTINVAVEVFPSPAISRIHLDAVGQCAAGGSHNIYAEVT